jgi:hypothetical protein
MSRMFRNLWTWIALTSAVLLGGGGALIQAQSSGGYPTSPTFQRVRIGPAQTTPAVGGLNMSGALVAAGNITGASVNGTGGAFPGVSTTGTFCQAEGGLSICWFVDASAPANQRVTAVYEDTGGIFHITAVNDANTSGTDVITAVRTGLTINSVLLNNQYPVTTGGVFTTSSGGCTVTQGQSNIASCTRNSPGNYTVTFSQTLGHNAVCTTAIDTTTVSITTGPIVMAQGGQPTTVAIVSANSSGAYDGVEFELHCM